VKIAFFGLPLAALALVEDGHDVTLAAICRKHAPGTRRLRRKLGDERVLVRPPIVGPSFEERVRSARPDLIVSWFWTTKIPMSIVRLAPLGGFGVHPSLLPKWRGPDPFFWAIDSGDEVTGVTAHRLAESYDTGAMLGRRTLGIDPSWDAWALARALDRPSLALLRELARELSSGRAPVEEAQDETKATKAPTPNDEVLEIDWQSDAVSIVRRIRAAAPFPGAWTFIGEEALVVTRASVTQVPKALRPGEAAVLDGRATVASGDGGVALLSGRVVGDRQERPVSAQEIAGLVLAAAGGA